MDKINSSRKTTKDLRPRQMSLGRGTMVLGLVRAYLDFLIIKNQAINSSKAAISAIVLTMETSR